MGVTEMETEDEPRQIENDTINKKKQHIVKANKAQEGNTEKSLYNKIQSEYTDN